TLLFSAGANLLRGLVSGIESMISSVISTVIGFGRRILGSIEGALGIGSPWKITYWRGQMLAPSPVGRAVSQPGAVSAAAARMVSGATGSPALASLSGPGGSAGSAGAGQGGQVTIVLQLGSLGGGDLDAFFLNWLRRNIRVLGGGSVQTALGYGS